MQPEDLLKNPVYSLWVATNAWQRLLRKALDPLGLTHAGYAILASVDNLQKAGMAVTQAEVARFGALDPNMVSAVVRNLISDGLLQRIPHPEDGRAYLLRLTGKGEHRLGECRERAIPLMQEFVAPLGDRREELADLLQSIVKRETSSPA